MSKKKTIDLVYYYIFPSPSRSQASSLTQSNMLQEHESKEANGAEHSTNSSEKNQDTNNKIPTKKLSNNKKMAKPRQTNIGESLDEYNKVKTCCLRQNLDVARPSPPAPALPPVLPPPPLF